MGHRLAFAVALLFVTAAPAAADIIVPPSKGGGPPKPVTESPKTPPLVDQVVEKKGCGSSRENGIEWIFGLGVLTLGVAGLRHVSPRSAHRALES